MSLPFDPFGGFPMHIQLLFSMAAILGRPLPRQLLGREPGAESSSESASALSQRRGAPRGQARLGYMARDPPAYVYAFWFGCPY